MAIRRAIGLAAALLVAGPPAAPAAADTPSVRIVDVAPASGAVLGRAEPLYVRVAYESDRPLRFQASGYVRGAERKGPHNAAPVHPAGRGEALCWLAFDDRTAIDEVRVLASDENWTEVRTVSRRVSASWTAAAGRRRTPAAWVRSLQAAENRLGAAQRAAATSGDDLLGSILMMLMGASLPAYIVLQVYAAVSSRGGWRTAALLPLWVAVPLVAFTALALLAGSNLWPLTLLFIAPLLVVYLLGTLLARTLLGGGDRGLSPSA